MSELKIEVTARATTPDGVAIAARQTSSWDKIIEIRVEPIADEVRVGMGAPMLAAGAPIPPLQGPEMYLTRAEARHLAAVLLEAAGDA